VSFGEFVAGQLRQGNLVVQPRMGFADPGQMRAGLIATKEANATTVGTITLDSYTRVGDLASAAFAVRDGIGLNGYPIVTHEPETTRGMLSGVLAEDFPVQVRHGSAKPKDIFAALLKAGLHASEGGPISYCLPYSRTPLHESVRNWLVAVDVMLDGAGEDAHLETFGGCMMGQLCPPSQLVAISALEALFFYRRGMRSISVSYAQQTNLQQDQEAVLALRRLCTELIPDASWHVVIYTYMGVYPRTWDGALNLLGRAAELAVTTDSARLIVKTPAEAFRIPTVVENVAALEHAGAVAKSTQGAPTGHGDEVYREAYALVDAVLNLDDDLGTALAIAFKCGLLDVPFCLHPDNAGRTRSYIGPDGRLGWADIGSLPLKGIVENQRRVAINSASLMAALSFVQNSFDSKVISTDEPRRLGA
jgi:methylaspartate mutase epsilon subunit